MKEFLAAALDFILCRITIFITGVRPPQELLNIGEGTKIYYANHASHGDFLLIFVSLPYRVRKRVRPVAAAEYWQGGPVRRFLAKNVFNMVLISRRKDPLEALTQMSEALRTHSLIIFPEGTRKMNDDLALQPFKSGIFRLAQQCPDVPLVPVWIKNARNVLPKGFFVPIPLLCELIVGEEIFDGGEGKGEFLQKAQDALLAMSETQNDKTKA